MADTTDTTDTSESSSRTAAADSTSSSSSSYDSSRSSSGGVSSSVQHMMAYKSETALWITRILTLIFTLLYLLPIWPSISQVSCYQKALLANAATSALRLHHRLPPFRFSREYMALLLQEDSAHYLLYSIIFIYNYPISLTLLPISLFAFLHTSSFTVTLIDKAGPRGTIGNMLSSVVESYQRSILQTVALTEIMLMPCIIFAILGGVGSIITPFIYYRFVSLRYSSRRNPYTRNMFHELRLSVEYLIYKPQCPQFMRNFVISMISVISRLAPQHMASN